MRRVLGMIRMIGTIGSRGTARSSLPPSLLALLLLPSAVRASGFEIAAQSPAGTAMAGAMTALATDASTIFYNPAGIALLPGGSALAGASLTLSSTRIVTPDGTVSDSSGGARSLSGLPTVYASSLVGAHLAAGVGVFSQFGGGVAFDGGTRDGAQVPFPGRFLGAEGSLRTVTVNPTVALRVLDGVAIGVGVDVVLASAELRRQLLVGGSEVDAHLGGTAQALGWNIGVQVRLVPERLTVGLAWRAGLELPFDLRAHFDLPVELTGVLRDQPVVTTVSLPHTLSVGVAVNPSRSTTLTADVRLALWSDARELRVDFPLATASPIRGAVRGVAPEVVVPERWRDAASLRLGFQWMAHDRLALRLGLGYDQSPVPAATLGPIASLGGNDRWLLSVGLGYTLPSTPARGLGLAIGYLAGPGASRTSSNPELPGAAYQQSTHLVSAALSYRWGPTVR